MGIENKILIPMSADHSSICKFESSDDPLYKQVKGVIDELVKKGLRILEMRQQMSGATTKVQGQWCPRARRSTDRFRWRTAPSGPPSHFDQSVIHTNPFQIATTAKNNALKTLDLGPLYRCVAVKNFRSQKVKMLHSWPWQTLEEEVIHQDHWWPPVSAETRCAKGVWITHYPLDTKLAKIVLSIDWHAYEGDPLEPLIERMIDTPTSEYHSGKHCGVIYLKNLLRGITGCTTRVGWRSPIYSPFVRDRERGNGSLSSDGPLEDILVNFTVLLQSIAHILVFGPFAPTTETLSPPFRFHYEGHHIWKHYNRQGITDKEAFKRAASFFSRAYNQNVPDEFEFTGQEEFHQHARDTSIVAITELLQLYKPELLNDEHAGDWDFREAFAKVRTQRSWAIEDRRWADKIVESCNLEYLKSSKKTQIQQEGHHKTLRFAI